MGQILLRQGKILEGMRCTRTALAIVQRGDAKDLWAATLLSVTWASSNQAMVCSRTSSN